MYRVVVCAFYSSPVSLGSWMGLISSREESSFTRGSRHMLLNISCYLRGRPQSSCFEGLIVYRHGAYRVDRISWMGLCIKQCTILCFIIKFIILLITWGLLALAPLGDSLGHQRSRLIKKCHLVGERDGRSQEGIFQNWEFWRMNCSAYIGASRWVGTLSVPRIFEDPRKRLESVSDEDNLQLLSSKWVWMKLFCLNS